MSILYENQLMGNCSADAVTLKKIFECSFLMNSMDDILDIQEIQEFRLELRVLVLCEFVPAYRPKLFVPKR